LRFQAAIFDLDGTLLDTLEDIGTAANEVLTRFEQPNHSIESYKTLVGDGVAVLFQRAWPETRLNEELLKQAILAFESTYAEQWNKRSKPYDGIEILLNRLLSRPMTLGVLSNKPDRFTKQCIDYFLSEMRFSSVAGQKPEVPRKPDPAGVHRMASEWKIRAEDIAYIGDTNTDMETAVAAGCCAIGVSWGFRAVEELRRSGAQQIFHTPSELGDFLLS
jgi:phosphoglycolate phosphatase